MLKTSSNIDAVIRRFEGFGRGVEAATVSVLHDAQWPTLLHRKAHSVLIGYFGASREILVAAFLKQMMSSFLADGFKMQMGEPEGEDASLGQAMQIEEDLTKRIYPGGKLRERKKPLDPNPYQQQVQANARAIVEEWVLSGEKRLRDGDKDLDPHEIAERVWQILMQRGNDNSSAVQEAKRNLTRAIDEWAATQDQEGGASQEEVDEAMQLVLDAWRDEVMSRAPKQVARELARLWKGAGKAGEKV